MVVFGYDWCWLFLVVFGAGLVVFSFTLFIRFGLFISFRLYDLWPVYRFEQVAILAVFVSRTSVKKMLGEGCTHGKSRLKQEEKFIVSIFTTGSSNFPTISTF